MRKEKILQRSSTLCQIRNASKIGYSEKISIVDALLEGHWCEEDDLLLAYQTLQDSDLDIAIVFFQLPFLMRLPEKWIPIRAEYGHPYVYFRTIGTIHNIVKRKEKYKVGIRTDFAETEKFKNAMLKNDFYGVLVRSQVLISFQLWEPRSRYYTAYLNALISKRDFKSVIVNSAESWLPDSQPLIAGTYETDLARRLRRETILALKEFIPAYAITCRDPYAQNLEYLNSYFMMVKSGRIVVLGTGLSMIAQFAQPFEFCDYSKNLSTLRRRLQSRKPPTVYEQYLLEAVRQVEIGSSNLAIVQTVMILDWFANEIIQDHLLPEVKESMSPRPNITKLIIDRLWETSDGRKDWATRVPTLEKFTRYFPATGVMLPSHLQGELSKIIKLRNKIVHRIQTDPIKSGTAKEAINIGMAVIQHCMDCLLSSKKPNKDQG